MKQPSSWAESQKIENIVLGDNSRMCTILIHVHWMETNVITELGTTLHTIH
jgi:hypothetical protein